MGFYTWRRAAKQARQFIYSQMGRLCREASRFLSYKQSLSLWYTIKIFPEHKKNLGEYRKTQLNTCEISLKNRHEYKTDTIMKFVQ